MSTALNDTASVPVDELLGQARVEPPHGLVGPALVPLGRVATGADVAAAVAFFASPDAAFSNCSILLVDGGMRASLHASAVASDSKRTQAETP